MAAGGPGTKYGRLTSMNVRLTSMRRGRLTVRRGALGNSADAATGRHASRTSDPHCLVPAAVTDTPPIMLAIARDIAALQIIEGLIVRTRGLAIEGDGREVASWMMMV